MATNPSGTDRAYEAVFTACRDLTSTEIHGEAAISPVETILGTIRFLGVCLAALEEQSAPLGGLMRMVARVTLGGPKP